MIQKIKSGNTTLIFNDEMAVKTQEEVDEILADIAREARQAIIDDIIKKQQNSIIN